MREQVRGWKLVAITSVLTATLASWSSSNRPTAPAARSEEPTVGTEAPTQVGTVTVLPDRAGSSSTCTLDRDAGPVSTGRVSVTAANETDGLAGFHMWRIADGHTYEEFAAHIQRERQLTLANKPFLGPRYTDLSSLIQIELQAGESGTMSGVARPGTYGIVCAKDFTKSRFGVFALVGPVEIS